MGKRIKEWLVILCVLGILVFPTIVWAQKRDENSITVGLVLEPPHLDPTVGAAAAIGEVVYANIFEGLTRINERGEVIPALAEQWDISPDGKVYTFFLHRNVSFHDGKKFDADDVKKSFDKLTAPDSINPQKQAFAAVQNVVVQDSFTVQITLSQPIGNFLNNLGLPAAVIVSHSAEDNRVTPVGTGPFFFKKWYRGDRIILQNNPDYWGEKSPLREVTFRFIPEPTAALAGILSKDIDVFPNYPAPEAVVRLKKDVVLSVTVGATQGKTILAMNNGRKPLDDIRVRRAIAHAIDRNRVIRDAMFGQALPIGSHFSPVEPGYIDLTQAYLPDSNLSQKLLQEAGLTSLELRLILPPPAYARRAGEVIAFQLHKNAGIKVLIEQVEWAQWLSQVFHDKNYDLTVISHVEPFDLDIYARPDYYFGYRSERYTALYNRLAQSMENTERIRLIQEAQRIISEDCVHVFLFLLPKIGVWNSDLEGNWVNVPIPVADVTKVRWKSRQDLKR